MTAFVELDKGLRLGIPALDEEHCAIVGLIDRLAREVTEAGPDVPGTKFVPALRELYAITQAHFSHEEKLMESMKFPGLAGHRREHAMLLAEQADFIRDIETGQERLDAESLAALRIWFLGHTIGSDRVYAAAFNDGQTSSRGDRA